VDVADEAFVQQVERIRDHAPEMNIPDMDEDVGRVGACVGFVHSRAIPPRMATAVSTRRRSSAPAARYAFRMVSTGKAGCAFERCKGMGARRMPAVATSPTLRIDGM